MPAMVPVRVRSIEHSIEAGMRAAAAEKDRDKKGVEEEDGLLLQNPESMVMRTLRLTSSDEHLQYQRQQSRSGLRPSARGDEGGGGGGAQVAPRPDEHDARVKTWSNEDRRRLGQFYQWYRTVLQPSVSEERGDAFYRP
ncbi:hypothetical protein Ct61P_15132 [Colletotrichum tofieldiae]|nr:hypothetical protein Ct61P_15132 [Colletotrichum tofieldiae]